jgi:hypothetical protein
LQSAVPIKSRHLDVEQNGVEVVGGQKRERIEAVWRRDGLAAEGFQRLLEHHAVHLVVVNHQHPAALGNPSAHCGVWLGELRR